MLWYFDLFDYEVDLVQAEREQGLELLEFDEVFLVTWSGLFRHISILLFMLFLLKESNLPFFTFDIHFKIVNNFSQ